MRKTLDFNVFSVCRHLSAPSCADSAPCNACAPSVASPPAASLAISSLAESNSMRRKASSHSVWGSGRSSCEHVRAQALEHGGQIRIRLRPPPARAPTWRARAGLRQHDQVPHKTQMGAVVDHFKLLVSPWSPPARDAPAASRAGAWPATAWCGGLRNRRRRPRAGLSIALALPVFVFQSPWASMPGDALAALLTAWRTGGLAMGAVKMPVIGVIGLFRRNASKVMAGEVIAPSMKPVSDPRRSGRDVASPAVAWQPPARQTAWPAAAPAPEPFLPA